MSDKKFAKIIIDISADSIDHTFTYRVPEGLAEELKIGSCVEVPFGNGRLTRKGYIVGFSSMADFDEEKIKEIVSVKKSALSADSSLIELAAFLAETYGSTFSQALKTVLPVKKSVRKNRRRKDAVKSIEQRTGAAVNTDKRLNEDQQKAVDTILSDSHTTFLLKGITGSGKTYVYINLIREMQSRGLQSIVLIPEISLTYQTVTELCAYFGDRVAVMHSRLSEGERYDQINKAVNGEIDIMVGPRSALFTPFDRLGLIIIDEEHERTYFSDTSPRYDAREAAAFRAKQYGAKLVLGSATPSVESYSRALSGVYGLVRLDRRAVEGAALPGVHVVDLRDELVRGNRSMISAELDELIRDRLDKKEQIILFINRRGYAGFVSCRSCGYVVKCPHCDVSLTAHNKWYYDNHAGSAGQGAGGSASQKSALLSCHYCGHTAPMPKLCPSCGSSYIAPFGTGTQKLEQMVRKQYPGARILRMDADTTSEKGAHESIIVAFKNKEADFLIGTQMIVKGHDFPDVTLVGVMAADMSLYAPDFTASERTFQLIVQASGRAGRSGKKGDVVIQTYDPSHYAVDSASRQSYEEFYEREMSYRGLMKYPPYSRMLGIQFSSDNEELLNSVCSAVEEEICRGRGASSLKELEYIGPFNASVYRINDNYRKILYIKASLHDIIYNSDTILNMVRENIRQLAAEMSDGKVKLSFELR